MKKIKSAFPGFRFPASVIGCAVRWYHRFNLSLWDIEELLLERGVVVTYESIRQWCGRFGSQFTCRAKASRARPGSTWHLDEMAVRLRGEPHWLWRAVDEHGTELDVLLQSRCAAYAGISFPFRPNPAVPRLAATLDAGP
jgi:putative transposase